MPLRGDRFHVRKTLSELPSFAAVQPSRNYGRLYRYAVLCGLLCIFALAFLPWQQSAIGEGRVIAYAPNERQQEISAPIEGRIKRWQVFEGSRVKAGDVIVELIDNDPEIIERMRLERDAVAQQVAAASVAVLTSKSSLDRQTLLFKKGLTSQRAVEQANLEYTGYLVGEAEASANLARMDIRLARQNAQLVKAPIDGTILRILAGEGGQIVKPGQMLAVIVPDTTARAVEVWVDGHDMPLIRDHAQVRIQFEGWPAIQFSGWPGAAVGTFKGKVALVDASDNGRGKFRVVVVPDGDPWPDEKHLRQGVRSMSWILLEKVNLGFELWRLFNGFPPNMPEQVGGYVAH